MSEQIIYTEQAQAKINKIISDGADNVQVIADFDKTLTYGNQESIIALLYNYNYLSESYSKKAKELENFYKPKEEDQSIPYEERKILMNEWWIKHENLLIESGLSKTHIENVTKSGIIKLRDGCYDMLDQLDKLGIPTIILSASGLGTDSIKIFLQGSLSKHKKLYVISNEFVRDDNNNAINWKEPVITSLNKDETVISQELFPQIYQEIKGRKNVILLGDKIEDLNMSDGINTDTILKIGFLNSWNENKLEFYKKHFDIVINGELGMGEIQNIIKLFENN